MAELCLMASHGYPTDLGLVFHPEQGFKRISKDFQHFLSTLACHGSNQDIINPLTLKSTSRWDCNCVMRSGSNILRPAHIGVVQGIHQDSVLFSSGIAEHCAREEKILKLLASGSIGVEGGSLDMSLLYDMVWSQPSIADFPLLTCHSRCLINDSETQQSLIYPTKELCLDEPVVGIPGDYCSCTESSFNYDSQLKRVSSMTGINDIISVISDIYLTKKTNKSFRQTMLVPYFERRRRPSINSNSAKLPIEKVGSLKSHDKVEEKAPQKKNRTKTNKERNISYVHACEILLSILVNKNQPGRNALQSLKKSGPELPELLNQISASIAGMGIAVIAVVVCRVACTIAPFCASNILSMGFGFGLIFLSWAVHNLRETVISIGRTSGKSGANDEKMMDLLERNLKDVYFRVVALMAVAVLRLV
ncbi:hypothetical protein F511_04493 [Dorcoceras hygrometricum]|uniref:Uncharacterized protein n=1 Tax=Dorcoceras hygrometricum TaxID=472368 RepID=A0A2Z7CAR8_9LAMI|nr:hypothetical protein F511_04493 [Dorcoceras hygrometricum]